jgi:hypothetical protein
VTVRFELPNPDHKLRPGSSATVKLRVAPKDIKSLVTAAKSSQQHEHLSQGDVLAVPESSVIDTGSQTIVYRESEPGVYEGVEVKLGPRMTRADEVAFFPILSGLKPSERVVTNGSFLVDAETRLNPSAGSIYFGGSSGSKGPNTSTIRSTSPEDPDEKVEGSLAKLSAEDRSLAKSQEFCAVLADSRLGSMGVPVKVMLKGQAVFVCCPGCEKGAVENADEVLKKVAELRKQSSEQGHNARNTAGKNLHGAEGAAQ